MLHSTTAALLVICSVSIIFADSIYGVNKVPCEVYSDVSPAIQSVLCSVEEKKWAISPSASALTQAGCLLGAKRCSRIMPIPLESQVPPSKPPPDARNQDYQRLATIAEKIVPSTWWRKGFDSDLLLLSHNDSELPRKQHHIRQLSSKKLRNLYQCVSRQVFIRISLNFNETMKMQQNPDAALKCTAMREPIVQKFQSLWHQHRHTLAGRIVSAANPHTVESTAREGSAYAAGRSSSRGSWYSNGDAASEQLLLAALDVLQHFYSNYGGIWTGCFRLDKYPDCRGALAAAAMIAATHFISDIAGKHNTFTEAQFVRGYLLSSLGRGLLHGDTGSIGNQPITTWGVKLSDFTALQGAYLQLYIDSFGALYKQQLDKHIPLVFPPNSFSPSMKMKWKQYAEKFEPVYTSVRNWMFTEAQVLIDFAPYRPLVAFQDVRAEIATSGCRRVLIDVGANGFFASPKYLLDSYAVYLPFTHAIMIEPVPHFSATVPDPYKRNYNISHLEIYAEVNTGSDTDMVKLLPKLVTKDDFVVLKFDVDPNRFAYGPTMEWGFLFSLMKNPEVAGLVDELYIEMHFHMPSMYWLHYHSNWEALDLFRYLRSQGVIIHAWP